MKLIIKDLLIYVHIFLLPYSISNISICGVKWGSYVWMEHVTYRVVCHDQYSFTVLRDFDEGILQSILEVKFEDDVKDIPLPPDVSNYLISEVSAFKLLSSFSELRT